MLHRVDAAMASLAVTVGERLGVLTTLESALAPTSALLLRTASQKGRTIELTQVLCDGAFEALGRGDHDRHDEQVREGLTDLALSVDAIVVAQGSTARVADSMDHELGVPVLSSLRPAAAWITDQLRWDESAPDRRSANLRAEPTRHAPLGTPSTSEWHGGRPGESRD